MNQFLVGVDLGTLQDFTPVGIIERKYERIAKPTMHDIRNGLEGPVSVDPFYHLRHLERFPLRTPYDQIIESIYTTMQTPPLLNNADLVVDATGVGRPVVDMMVRVGLNPIPVTITGGSAASWTQDGYHVPKADIVGALQMLFSSRRLKIASTLPLAPVFIKEVENFKMKITKAGNDTYEAWREKDHDDIVLAVAVACWYEVMINGPGQQYPDRTRELIKETPYNPFEYLDSE